MTLTCTVCGYQYRRRDGFASVSLSKGETELEQLKSWERYEVCESCADVLKSWLGLRVEPRTKPYDEDLMRPYSCHDERLGY